ncbi:alcohol dehydrogenase catalytic domain-containing protein [Bradyrhizobium altum]|uniref:alcohol dehydrogenase catalytic domain-containing protein n=1 Tax=Bradyrhizobium altum TaxID=1571202 RepID=UPI00289D173D|nr:alcohol dehydrogenase catalytic domain-containing protein [Bradyrhizobium altum]
MKAVVLREFGGLENLSLDDLPIPRVSRGSVLIRAAAASVNPVDVSIRKGSPFSPSLPGTIGCDVAGVVEAVGEDVREFAPGDEVFGCVGGVRGSGGTLAQYVLADARLLAQKKNSFHERGGCAAPRCDHGPRRTNSWRRFARTPRPGPRWYRWSRSRGHTARRGVWRKGFYHGIGGIARDCIAHGCHRRDRLSG